MKWGYLGIPLLWRSGDLAEANNLSSAQHWVKPASCNGEWCGRILKYMQQWMWHRWLRRGTLWRPYLHYMCRNAHPVLAWPPRADRHESGGQGPTVFELVTLNWSSPCGEWALGENEFGIICQTLLILAEEREQQCGRINLRSTQIHKFIKSIQFHKFINIIIVNRHCPVNSCLWHTYKLLNDI